MPRLDVNGITIDYSVYGPRDAPPVLMIMGLGMIKEGWQRQLEAFSEQHRVIIFDNRGVGGSDRPRGPYTTQMMAQDALGLLDALGLGTAAVVGISMGGMIAQQLALRAPARIERLVLAATYAKITASVHATLKRGMTEIGLGDVHHPPLGAIAPTVVYDFLLPRIFTRSYLETHTSDLEAITRALEATNPSFAGVLFQIVATQTHNLIDRLHGITVPTLVMVGTDDRLIPPSCSQVIHERLPNSQLVTIDNGPHALNWECASVFNRTVLAFLDAEAGTALPVPGSNLAG